ncbi:hypothetical protein QF026_008380 [Streptomyces aurantiacus]|uniref:hypothetical protein n=1 Tax=Streptomyces aurantiacus TaxID=47760 RepID=UPI00278DA396|nr:hypothetical protein [Streptomyces aurantiacus]MDQ0779914.1 hypothetical protein [Streptomyces aurantiacus]
MEPDAAGRCLVTDLVGDRGAEVSALGAQPDSAGFPEKPNPGSDGMTRWKA